MVPAGRSARLAAAALVSAVLASCGHHGDGPRLEREDDENVAIPDVPVPPENGPRLGATGNVVPVYDRPSKHGRQLGSLHAGATVARAAEPLSTRGCDGGWFAIRPMGFVCASATATTDLEHPTLIAMSMKAARDATLPYTYARAVRDTALYESDPKRDDAVRSLGTLRAKSGMAIVGSWTASAPDGTPTRLAMTTEGHFVPAGDLEAASPSEFGGVLLGDGARLPIAFVVKRGVHAWAIRDGDPEKQDPIGYHARLELTGRTRTVSGVEFWAAADGRWVRLPDVTLVRRRTELPGFATGEQKWIDVSVVTGTLVAYEGSRAVFATLASVGRDRLGAPDGTAATQRGDFEVTAKHLTLLGRDPATFTEGISIYDVPWALELSSGQLVLGAYWHDRFGVEHGPGNIELSPKDAAYLFRWADPALPEGWHSVSTSKTVIVSVRK